MIDYLDSNFELIYKVTCELVKDKYSDTYRVHFRELDSINNHEHGASFILDTRQLADAKQDIFRIAIDRLTKDIVLSNLERERNSSDIKRSAINYLTVPRMWEPV